MKTTFLGLLGGAVLVGATVGMAAQQMSTDDLDPETKARVERFDKGPDRIDVSKYPPEMRDTYNKVFRPKCGKCHTIARAINSDYVLDDEWERYIKRMARRAGTFISGAEGKQIYQFVTHDSKVRRKDLYEKKLKESQAAGGK